MDSRKRDSKKDRQLAALLASAGIIGFALVYWGVQIQSVLETLTMARG
jgi:hypothetical protein